MLNLLRLGRMTANPSLEEKASQLGKAFSREIEKSPFAYPQLMCALNFAIGPSSEIVIAGKKEAKDTKNLLQVLQTQFIPNKIVLLNPINEGSPHIHRLAEFTRKQVCVNDKATAYVCRNYKCQFPTNHPSEMLELIKSGN